MTEEVTEIPRCFSISIQSLVACLLALRALTDPARRIAPPNSSSFSVSVVFPASGWEMIANVRRLSTSCCSTWSNALLMLTFLSFHKFTFSIVTYFVLPLSKNTLCPRRDIKVFPATPILFARHPFG
ncbi:hypothetical protein D3C81_1173900 [compost metagenome]